MSRTWSNLSELVCAIVSEGFLHLYLRLSCRP
jgi:hypothetical protein